MGSLLIIITTRFDKKSCLVVYSRLCLQAAHLFTFTNMSFKQVSRRLGSDDESYAVLLCSCSGNPFGPGTAKKSRHPSPWLEAAVSNTSICDRRYIYTKHNNNICCKTAIINMIHHVSRPWLLRDCFFYTQTRTHSSQQAVSGRLWYRGERLTRKFPLLYIIHCCGVCVCLTRDCGGVCAMCTSFHSYSKSWRQKTSSLLVFHSLPVSTFFLFAWSVPSLALVSLVLPPSYWCCYADAFAYIQCHGRRRHHWAGEKVGKTDQCAINQIDNQPTNQSIKIQPFGLANHERHQNHWLRGRRRRRRRRKKKNMSGQVRSDTAVHTHRMYTSSSYDIIIVQAWSLDSNQSRS